MATGNWFTNGFGAAIADIREKLVEEAWFGRRLTPTQTPAEPTLSEGMNWAKQPRDSNSPSPEPDHGMDRDR